jgi:hypothetical protein
MPKFPTKYPLDYSIIPIPNRLLLFFDKGTNTLYSRNIGTGGIDTSIDWGVNWVALTGSCGGLRVDNLAVLPNGNIVTTDLQGGVWLSTDDGASFTQVASGAAPLGTSGITFYDKFVFISAYGSGKKVIWSKDYGATWNTLLEALDPTQRISHCHDICFDPYENIIWTCWGDNRPADKIVYSCDLGKTWTVSPEYHRCTSIMPLPNYVLFGTDEFSTLGTWKHTRLEIGTAQTFINPVLNWAARKDTFEGAINSWASRPAIVYGDESNAVAYWGYYCSVGNTVPAVYASDGMKTRTIWSGDKLIDGATNGGIIGCWGPTSEGVLVASLKSVYKDASDADCNYHILKITIV